MDAKMIETCNHQLFLNHFSSNIFSIDDTFLVAD